MERKTGHQNVINNDFYDALGEDWYEESAHPIGLLRAENRLRLPWVTQVIRDKLDQNASVLDIGCGGGLLSNGLAKEGFQVTGIDLSESSLRVAQMKDATKSVEYLCANAYKLPFEDQIFDVACAMDILEHVEDPEKLIAEASRVLKPGGLFFFHTFNRTLMSYLMVIKGVELFVKNTPKRMHVQHLFIRPKELESFCMKHGFRVGKIYGFRPKIFHKSLLNMLLKRTVPEDFQFIFSKNQQTGYCGFALRAGPPHC